MAQTKTDYGLIYNTDGSVCTTVRSDQIPFPGVRSFAVEEATENLFKPPFDYVHSNFLVSVSDPTGKFDTVIRANPATGSSYMFKDIQTVIDTAYSGQVWCYVSPDFDGTGWVGIRCERGLNALGAYYNKSKKGTWQFLKKENVVATSTNSRLLLYIFNGFTSGYVLFKNFQVEQKPFCTSFVDGSRPTGRLVISVEDLKFDIANDDWVISYWKYPVATYNDTQNSYNLCTLGQWASNKTKGYIEFGKENNMNKYRLAVALNDATAVAINSNNTFNPTDYFYHWHYEVVKKSGKVLSYYVDGVKQCELTIPANKEIQTPFDVGLSLGGYYLENIFYPTNALIAAPYYGYNSATWTDDYIREVYEAKIPFAVQNQLSIY